MTRTVHIPKYTSKDIPILVASMLPMSVLLNYFLYGNRYFNSMPVFFWATLVTFIILGIGFLFFGFVAIYLRSRFPRDEQVFRRLTIAITLFFLMSLVYISLLLRGYDYFGFLGYEFREADFTKSYISFMVMNVFLTFLNEGVYRFEKYRATITETEQLKKEYMQSQLLGLKSQVNPHFLFNSLNTLSSLIHEDAETAEDFLNHMSKVYRYLLRNNEEQLVTLDTELNFVCSYYYLLKSRHAEGLQLSLNVPAEIRNQLIPPLTLQMIFENSLNQNVISKSRPLVIEIDFDSESDHLVMKNNIQPKINNLDDYNEGLENISKKYRLLCQQEIIIAEKEGTRVIQLPLITEKEMAEA
jgi:two-component system LytT family sensor kinase